MGRQRVFAFRIWVEDSDGETHDFKAGDPVPGWAAKVIDNPKAYADGDGAEETPAAPEPAAVVVSERPETPAAQADDVAQSDTGNDETEDGAEVEPPADYKSLDKAGLEAEVAKRNQGRDADDLIVVEGKGNKPDLVAALQADDVAQSDTGN